MAHLQEIEGKSPDILVSLPPTSPLRDMRDVERAISLFREGGSDMVVAITPSQRSPWFNMVSANGSGELRTLGERRALPITRRQDAPKVWDITTVVYVASAECVMSTQSLMDGKVRGIEVSPHTSIDIDTELDLRIASFLVQENLLGQKH